MRERSPRTKIAPHAFGLGLAMALVATQGDALPAPHNTALNIDEHGCRFSPQVSRVLSALPEYSDMQVHTEQRAARFAFESLHGLGIVENWDAEWSEVRLYFREDLPALKDALGRIGFRVDENGHIGVPATAEDDMALNVEAHANDGRHFAEARSYLACGSV